MPYDQVIVLTIGGIMFVITTFNTLYQSKLAQQATPWMLRFIFKIVAGVIYPISIIACKLSLTVEWD